jgi:hypothetical protein
VSDLYSCKLREFDRKYNSVWNNTARFAFVLYRRLNPPSSAERAEIGTTAPRKKYASVADFDMVQSPG